LILASEITREVVVDYGVLAVVSIFQAILIYNVMIFKYRSVFGVNQNSNLVYFDPSTVKITDRD